MAEEDTTTPVITLYFSRLQKLLRKELAKDSILGWLPYLGLDLEEITGEYTRVEYNPNRPDFSTDYGIARALNGLLGLEKGAPRYKARKGTVQIITDPSVKGVRPYIVGAAVRNLRLDDETLRQIISMQEDLHNGIGRRRRKVAIGLHNLDVLSPPITYSTARSDFKFIPLGYESPLSILEILRDTEPGRHYSAILQGFNWYPILRDSNRNVLSFPPIINGELTRVTPSTVNLFIDITGTEMKAVEDVLSILSAAFQDVGGDLEAVEIHHGRKHISTPNLAPSTMSLDLKYANKLLGLDLSTRKAVECLARSRLGAIPHRDRIDVMIPRYRTDILHQVDLVEEIAIGFGLQRIQPTMPSSHRIGSFNKLIGQLDVVRETMVSLGFIEVMNFSLLSKRLLREANVEAAETSFSVENPKTAEHETLRPKLLPSLLEVLSRNIHEEHPQRIFEIGKVFAPGKGEIAVDETFHLGVSIAHSHTNYSEVKSYLTSFLSQAFGIESSTVAKADSMFIEGRAAEVRAEEQAIGMIGEISPQVLENLGLKTPVSAYEVDLKKILG